MKNINWKEVQEATDFERPAPGGYICSITSAEDEPSKEYIRCYYDIAEGKFKNYYSDLNKRLNWNMPFFNKSYKESALGYFKRFIVAIEKSNPGFTFNNDEKKLRGKVVGLVLGEEEFEKKDGSIGTRLTVVDFKPINDIRSNNFTIPKLKKLKVDENKSTYSDIEEIGDDDSDLPWA